MKTRQKITDFLIAAVVAVGALAMQSCTDDDDHGMPVGAACQHRTDDFVKCGRNQFRPA
jgi:hypothetical protein